MNLNSIPAPGSAHNSTPDPEELQKTLLSRATSLSETALRVLLCKRDKLTLEQRSIEDEIAKCDERIKNIKGDLELQLETILESCNETYPRRNLQESNDKSAWQSNKRVKLCEPQPSTKSMCEKLDDICIENNWVLPNYRVSLSDGGFEAEVRIDVTHFAHTISGEEKSDAEEARESAAACMLTKLQHNAITSNYLNLTGNIYIALRKLRSLLLKECPDGVMAYDIFSNRTLQEISLNIPRNKEELLEINGPNALGKDKVSKYGDRLLETVESTINEYYATRKKGSMEFMGMEIKMGWT